MFHELLPLLPSSGHSIHPSAFAGTASNPAAAAARSTSATAAALRRTPRRHQSQITQPQIANGTTLGTAIVPLKTITTVLTTTPANQSSSHPSTATTPIRTFVRAPSR